VTSAADSSTTWPFGQPGVPATITTRLIGPPSVSQPGMADVIAALDEGPQIASANRLVKLLGSGVERRPGAVGENDLVLQVQPRGS
jgi:hypothetical protein